MLNVKLINMPFAALNTPSIALAQLKEVVNRELEDGVVEELYLNHEFGVYLDHDAYSFIAHSGEGHTCGFGEWFFRQVAFPELEDNSKQFFDRYSTHFSPDHMAMYQNVLAKKRETLDPFLDQIIDQYEIDQADVVGFTSMFFQTLPSAALARKLKERKPEIVIVIGGANCEAPMGIELARNMACFDFVFSGFGLISFPKFLKHIAAGEREECYKINGVFCKENSAQDELTGTQGSMLKILPNKQQPIGDELDINGPLIRMNYDSFLESYEEHFVYSKIKPYLFFETSRGCWWGQRSHCTFCGLNGGSMVYRAMKPELAKEMFEDLFERYGDQVDHLSGVDNIIPKEYVTDLLPKLDVPDNITMFYEVRADLSDDDMKVLADAHVFEIQPGIEAMNTHTLKLMAKGTTAFNNVNFLKHAVKHSVYPAWNLLIGFPGEVIETYEKYLADLQLLAHLPPPDDAFPVRFDRFSPYFMKAEHFQLDLHPLAWYSLTYPFPESTLSNLAFYFEDRNYGAEYIKNTSLFVQPLKQKVATWKKLWLDAHERGTKPELYFKDQKYSNAIFDSRFGENQEYQISDDAKKILRLCSRAKTFGSLVRESELEATEAQTAIDELNEKGLLYNEGKGMLNLVFDTATSFTNAQFFHAISS